MAHLSIVILLVMLSVATSQKSRPGRCPSPPYKSDKPFIACDTDDTCPDKQKCCYKCMDPVCLYGYDGNCTEDKLSCRKGTTCVPDDILDPKSSAICCIDEEIDMPKDPKDCKESYSVGPCKAAFSRYFYNETSNQCEEFVWGGCSPKGNNFVSKTYCTQVCKNVCMQPSKKGPCKNKVKSWYYDSVECKCKKFVYSGCNGNDNRFVSKSECETACGNAVCKACTMEKKIWPCKAAKPRFYYNAKKGKCEQFIWGGCKPNANNFRNAKECNAACKRHVCTLPLKPGPCKKGVKRFYFDIVTNKCKVFIWGGCKPNGNNFKNMKACKSKCVPKKKNKD